MTSLLCSALLAVSSFLAISEKLPLKQVQVATRIETKEEVRYFSSLEKMERFFSPAIKDSVEKATLLASFDFANHDYVFVEIYGDCNARVNFLLNKNEAQQTLEFRYVLIDGGCRSVTGRQYWLEVPNQEADYRFVVLPSGRT